MKIKRHALAVAACELVPVPLLDTALQNVVRRNLVRGIAETSGLKLEPYEIQALADEELAPAKRALVWPVKKLLSKVFFPLSMGLAVYAGWKTIELADEMLQRM
jgi:hypothetical protein